MESNRFDALTRGISETNSRRGMLKTLAASGLGAVHPVQREQPV